MSVLCVWMFGVWRARIGDGWGCLYAVDACLRMRLCCIDVIACAFRVAGEHTNMTKRRCRCRCRCPHRRFSSAHRTLMVYLLCMMISVVRISFYSCRHPFVDAHTHAFIFDVNHARVSRAQRGSVGSYSTSVHARTITCRCVCVCV